MLKVDRASKGVRDLNELFRERRPFGYFVETNTKTCKRATFAKKNKTVVNEAAIMCGEIIHNLRSALDHVYWEIVSPFASTERERKKVQFPFCEEAGRLQKTVEDRLADRVSPKFFKAIMDLKPHGEPGGNELLYLIDKLDILDKHRLLIPTGDYTRISEQLLRAQVPDFPQDLSIDCVIFGSNQRDIMWGVPRHVLARIDLGGIRPPTLNQFEKELDVPVDIVFEIGGDGTPRPVIPTLHALVNVTAKTIKIIKAAAR
ncbi:hypothetical protein KEU06_19535 [Pseudaminobacter sp. 19-2017]|uniref:Uncharacterized protein n=1 Tax=Pseudaminobacter soli (ex Zhang et al. 2022) TaxID=2831468 RepID=A0A942I3T0_9HYPH|nr:hypothetical protein [Pseudaminobacter soli]MBS3650808.1 hypothetical protein [Pseudaminobacter soli]